MTVLLTLAYAAVAALLLNLGLESRWSPRVKLGAVVVVSLLYYGTYGGLRSMEGWPTGEAPPEEFRLHWVAIDEPDKESGSAGAIYLWLRGLDDAGFPTGPPRAHVRPYDPETAEAARAALALLEGGKPVNGHVDFSAVASVELTDDSGNESSNRREIEVAGRPRFEFRQVPPPDLPPKPLL